MEAASGEGEEGLADRLGERRMGMDVVHHIGRFGIPADDQLTLGDHLGDVRTDEMDAEWS